jgi:hypothetical protein
MTAEVVGVASMARFFHDCFQGQTYAVTHQGTLEHERLWGCYDEGEQGPLDSSVGAMMRGSKDRWTLALD